MIIYDIETKTFGKPDPDKDILRAIGFYDYDTNEYLVLKDTDKERIKALFKKHRVVIGFNNKYYDDPILKRFGVNLNDNLVLDLREIIKKREDVLNCKNESKSLRNLAKFFNISVSKGDLDYNILKKDSWTVEEWHDIVTYTQQDIKVTKELFDYIHKYFEPFKEYLDDWSNINFKWLTTSLGAYAYKVICLKTGLCEEYTDKFENESYEGGYVAEPITDFVKGNIYCLDFNSLYPHIFIQGNLYTHNCKCCTNEEKWKGNDMFKVNGAYCSKTLGKIESLLKEFYNLRLQYKKEKDNREYVIKIIINTIYGLSGTQLFKSLYNYNTASDCTLIGRESTKYARKVFIDAGYNVVYSDTDSVYLEDVFNDKEKMLKIKDDIISHIKKHLPFAQDTFDMGIDEEIKYMYFFNKNGKRLKKHYVYVTKDNEVKLKGLAMIKSDSSKIGYLIFKKYMEENIKNGKQVHKFDDVYNWVKIEIENNLNIMARKFTVNNFDTYKNETQLQAQIAKQYGAGTHFLIQNKYFGVGKGSKYCTIDEFKNKGLNINAIILNKVWSELEPFMDIIPTPQKKRKKKNEELLKWVM